jgi:hypothetical protein
MKKLRLSAILLLSVFLVLTAIQNLSAEQIQRQNQGQAQGQVQNQIMDPEISVSASVVQNSKVSEIPPNHIPHPAQLYQMGLPQIFGPQSLPGNANNSFLRMTQIFPQAIDFLEYKYKMENYERSYVIEDEGRSGKTNIVFYYYPGRYPVNDSENRQPDKIETRTALPKAKYSPIGFLSLTALKGQVEFPILLNDAVAFMFNAKFNPVIANLQKVVLYIDPFGVSVNLGNEGRARSFSILGGGATLHKNGDMSFGGGIGTGSGEVYPAAVIGMKFWVLIEDEAGKEVELPTTMKPLKVPVAEEAPVAPKAKAVDVVNYPKEIEKPMVELPKEVEQVKKEIEQISEKLIKCPNLSRENALARREAGYHYLHYYTLTRDKGALDAAMLNFAQSLRNPLPKEFFKDVHTSLAVIWLEKSKIAEKDREPYLKKTLSWAKMANIDVVPALEEWIEKWKEKK